MDHVYYERFFYDDLTKSQKEIFYSLYLIYNKGKLVYHSLDTVYKGGGVFHTTPPTLLFSKDNFIIRYDLYRELKDLFRWVSGYPRRRLYYSCCNQEQKDIMYSIYLISEKHYLEFSNIYKLFKTNSTVLEILDFYFVFNRDYVSLSPFSYEWVREMIDYKDT